MEKLDHVVFFKNLGVMVIKIGPEKYFPIELGLKHIKILALFLFSKNLDCVILTMGQISIYQKKLGLKPLKINPA